MASLQMTRQALASSESQRTASVPNATSISQPKSLSVKSDQTHQVLPHKRAEEDQESEAMARTVESVPLQFKPLEEDHIEQMIEELLDYGSVELSSVFSP